MIQKSRVLLNYCIVCFLTLVSLAYTWTSMHANNPHSGTCHILCVDTIPQNEDKPFILREQNGIKLADPAVIEQKVEYDPATGQYILTEKIGDDYYRAPTYMTFNEYVEWKSKQQEKAFFGRLAGVSTGKGSTSSIKDPLQEYTKDVNLLDRLFGGNEVKIQPQGNLDIFLGVTYRNTENPIQPIQQQRQWVPDFDLDIRMNVSGQIGKKLNLNANFNTQQQFNFENQLKLKFDSEQFSEDDILKNIEAGNVSLPLKSQLIQGTQSLFGIKTELQFGHLRLTAIASQERSRKKNLTIQNGAQQQQFEVRIDQYDENRHFFITHFNREDYERALTNLPQVNTTFRINRIEVWRTNIQNETERLRDIVAVADLGEPERFVTPEAEQYRLSSFPPELITFSGKPLPDNRSNRLYEEIQNNTDATLSATVIPSFVNNLGLRTGQDFELKRAQRLRPNEYTLNEQLGVLSLNVPLRQEEVLAIAVEYLYNGETYRIGEFGNESESDSTKVLVTKMLKSATPNIANPLWDLMMKNVYSVGAYQVSSTTFNMDIFYDDPGEGYKRFLPEKGTFGKPLLQWFNMDQLNAFGDPQSDGRFDFVPGITIDPRAGRIFFPVLEPFGSSLKAALNNDDIYEKYEYEELYDSTIFIAQEYQEKNRFLLRGQFESSITSEIQLGAFNIPEGSVRVTAGGRLLREGVDYEVNYSTGIVKILNDSYLASGAPINVEFEDQSLFSFQNRNMIGLRADYELNKKINLGGTFMQLWEQPVTQKVNLGDDPINNRVLGLDVSYTDEAPWLTKAVDFLPGIETKAPSSISAYAEGAALMPGYSRAINLQDDEGSSVYIDDFEGTAARIDLTQPLDRWALASIPAGDPTDQSFREAFTPDIELSNVNRALINWYRFDPVLQDRNNRYGEWDVYSRIVSQEEIFPQRTLVPGLNIFRPLDITYYPDERGQYNYDVPGGTPFSAGVEEGTGRLLNPESRWGGIMRGLPINDFQSANVEYIEFWMLNPFIASDARGNQVPSSGDMYIELGNISEDILRDGRAAFENGLPVAGQSLPTDRTPLGVVPQQAPFVNAFANDPESRTQQDVGLDGMSTNQERSELTDYVNAMVSVPGVANDPNNDDFRHFLDASFDNNIYVLDRYKDYNKTENNSPVNQGTRNVQAFSFYPSTEDINRDFTSDRIEGYFQYKIPLDKSPSNPNRMRFNKYITDSINTRGGDQVWYRFVIPVQDFDRKLGAIQDFRSIRFLRMYFKGFDSRVTMRFATFDLVRNSWRRFTRSQIFEESGAGPFIEDEVSFAINQVGIEENSAKVPYNYTIPPGIQREQNFQATAQNQLLNESSLAINICGLPDGSARAVFRNDQRDLRLYERIKMFVHAESTDGNIYEKGDLKLFIRMGSDYINNFYEYEIPLTTAQAISNNPQEIEAIWPDENILDFALQELIDAKLERNSAGFDFNDIFSKAAIANPEHTVKVKGNPNLGFVKGFMVGIRNADDNKGPVCAEVWLNELRVTGLDRKGGTAAHGRVDMQLADFGNLSLTGTATSIGWGGIDQRLQERSREQVTEYDISTNLQLGKLFGENSIIQLPFYAQLSNTTRKPQFDPYDLDIELDDKLDRIPNADDRDSVRDQSLDKTTIRSFNFTNVRITPNRNKKKEKGEEAQNDSPNPQGIQRTSNKTQTPSPKKNNNKKNKKRVPKPWDIENFSFSYAFSETDHSDPIIQSDNTKTHNASITYNYNLKPLYIEPFKNVIKSKWLAFIKELHLNPIPNSYSVSTNVNRYLNTRTYRFSNPEYSTWFDRRFTWDRTYGLRWDLTRSLKINFNATHSTVIDELDEQGRDFRGDTLNVDPKTYRWNNIRDFGRPKNYQQNVAVTWNVPTKNIPLLSFARVNVRASADYGWTAAAINVDSLGNLIQNNQNFQINSTFNFEQIYNKVKYFRALDQTRSSRRNNSRTRGSRNSNNNKSDDEEADDKKKKKKGRSGPSVVEKILVRPLLSIRKAQFNYQEKRGHTLPGFFPQAELFGMGQGLTAPGWEYLLGFQPSQEWLFDAAENKGWITASRYLSQEVLQNYSQSWNGELNIEPWKDFRIDVNMNKSYNETATALFKNKDVPVDDPYTDFRQADYVYSPQKLFGSYTISYLALNTLFEDSQEELNNLFQTFEGYRTQISNRLYPNGLEHEQDAGYKDGFGRKQQEVLTASFIAAYTGQNPDAVTLNLFDIFPRPNWSLNYNGLSRIPMFQKVFKNVRLNHSYNSTLTVNSFQRNAAFLDEAPLSSENQDNEANFYSRLVIPQVVVDEKFSPLIGIDVKMQNNMQFNFSINRGRTLQLSFTDTKLFETKNRDYTFGFGYTMEDVTIGFLNFGKKKKKRRSSSKQPKNNRNSNQSKRGGGSSNNLVFNLNFKYVDQVTNAYEIDLTNDPIPTRGNETIQINPSVDYDINKFVTLRVFMDYTRTIPKTSLSFPVTNARGGITLRFKLNGLP